MNKFSTTSKERLATAHPDLIKVMEKAITISPMDFGIAYGYRSPQKQHELYQQGRTKPGAIVTNIDGYKKKSKHNEYPSHAVDIYAFIQGKAVWEVTELTFLAGIILATAKLLKQSGEITHDLVWGGNWDGDGEIITDQKFMDLPHFEIKI